MNASMHHGQHRVEPHKVHRHLARGLQDRDLAVDIRHDDVNFRNVEYPTPDAALGYQNMAGIRPHILDATDTANKKLRHYGRFHNIPCHDYCLPAGVVVFVAGKAEMHGTESYTSGRTRNVSSCNRKALQRGKQVTTPYRNQDMYGGAA